MKSNISLLFFLTALIFVQKPQFAQKIFINEFMASNLSTISDPDYNDYADWIELFNAGDESVDLLGYSITDNLSQPQKYRFQTSINIQPKQFLIIWADDRNTGAHTNFKLSADGESIGLFSPSGDVIDSVTFGMQQNNISSGRFPDGAHDWYLFSPASPGTENIEDNIINILSVPAVSHQSGFYSNPFSLTVSNKDPDVVIRYTIDGRIPTINDPFYTAPIQIDSTSILRLRTFKEGFMPGKTLSLSYFINEQTGLPVFSLITDPANFFSDTSGIYVEGTNGISGNCSSSPRNWNQDWERPVDLEFFEDDKSLAFKVSAGVKIFGGCSRIYPMKSLAFYFRSEYGFKVLPYRLFPDNLLPEYNNFILRSSGQDWWRTMFRDGMVQTLIEQGMKLDYQNYRSAVLFINGQYWGIHNIREKLNEHYIGYHHPVDKNNLDIIEISKETRVNQGDRKAYDEMINFLSNNNMAIQENYSYIKSIIDVDEYIDYLAAQIYSANGDWPGSNVKLWRERTPNGKWRWMIYDLDFTFGGNAQGVAATNTLAQATAVNGPSWPNPPWATLMFRKLLENPEFKDEFIQRFAAHMNTTFETAHVHRVIDSLGAAIASEIPRHKQRWTQSISMGSVWENNVKVMKDFASNRPVNVRGHFNTKFELAGSYGIRITINEPTWGKVFTHTVEIKKNGAQYVFFKNIPLKIYALPMPGYRFVSWEGASSSSSPSITITASSSTDLVAIFEPADLNVTGIIINEINYKSSPLFDTEDWVELYNPADTLVDITGWMFSDGKTSNQFFFPENTVIAAKDYLVLCRDTSKFLSLRNDVPSLIGNLPFGFSSDGETLQLKGASGDIVNGVKYLSSGDWTSLPNGSGAALALINPQFDNSLPENWKASQLFGTPGKLNDVYTKAEEEADESLPRTAVLYQNYPNPFNPVARINYQIANDSRVALTVFNILGQKIITLVDEYKHSGYYHADFDGRNYTSGIYLYRLEAGDFISVKKMVLAR
jgi:hypothetical protein